MPRDPFPLRRPGHARRARRVSGSPTADRPPLGWLSGALALGLLLACGLGCTSVSDPIRTPSTRLKTLVNPLGAHAEQRAFEQRVKDDPFPAAQTGGVQVARKG